ncbi:protein ABIL2-like isoform X3 [Alnus glutinosa]|uniref:protein ABIL2-like isoform X3 n=1 Tax=Alnus glutinosa TaxID=3517 RepID=UPI002D785817|nr:protein ABIL2-like isoform X3 [Alnus glutinosa]
MTQLLNVGIRNQDEQAKSIHFMESVKSPSSVSVKQEASHNDELFMQKRLFFSDSLKELKDLRKQLYSAAEHFEAAYSKEDQDHTVLVETLKDYAIKAFVNTVDHLGSVAYKVNGFLDEKICELSRTELRFSCIEQRLRTCQYFTDCGGLFQQSLAVKFPRHHKRYIFPAGTTTDAVGHSQPIHKKAKEDFCQFGSGKAVHATTSETPPTIVRKRHPALWSPQSSSRPGTFQFTKVASRRAPENRSVSPCRFPFIRSGSLVRRSTATNYSTANKRYPSEPRRSVSLPIHAERDRSKGILQNSGKSKGLLKALLSMHKSKREGILYK